MQFNQRSSSIVIEVSELHILRAMVESSYVTARYTTVSSENYFITPSRRRSGKVYMKERKSAGHSEADPLDWDFRTEPYCREHHECNDPIFYCFKISKTANDLANSQPEYRREYK